MRIDGVGSQPLPVPIVPASDPAAAGATNASVTSLVNQALIEQQQRGGGGGGHGAHGAPKKALDAIDDIAARAAIKLERERSPLQRQREIDKLTAEFEAAAERVDEKPKGRDGRREGEPSEDDDEQAVAE